MSLGTILGIVLVVALHGGFMGVAGGYGFGHGGVGVPGAMPVVLVAIVVTGRR